MKSMKIGMLLIYLVVFTTTILSARAEPPTWTDEDTETFWKQLAGKSTRTKTSPRFEKADEESGEGVLEGFGTKYMPNAYEYYQQVREKAKEREQILLENFPNGRKSDSSDGSLYEKTRNACAKSVAEMFRRHDELCHFYFLHKLGVMTDENLAKSDEEKISMLLPPSELGDNVYMEYGWEKGTISLMKHPASSEYHGELAIPAEAEQEFARKHLPNLWAELERFQTMFDEGKSSYNELFDEARRLDAPRCGIVFRVLSDRLDDMKKIPEEFYSKLKSQRLAYAIEEVSSEELAELDEKHCAELARKRKEFEVNGKRSIIVLVLKGVRQSIDEEVIAPCNLKKQIVSDMVAIPGKNYMMCKFEVSQHQWLTIMKDNPAWFPGKRGLYGQVKETGENHPIETILFKDLKTFILRLNAFPDLSGSGLVFRLPTEEEWDYACRAGSGGRYCKLANGTEISEGTVGQVAWCRENSGDQTHPVGQKKPNAFGLYDMLGNVEEWTATQTVNGEVIFCGNDYHARAKYVSSSSRSHEGVRFPESFRRSYRGFRLCADMAKGR